MLAMRVPLPIYAMLPVKPLTEHRRHTRVRKHLAKDLLGHPRLEAPHHVGIDPVALRPLAILLERLFRPGGALRVVSVDALVEFASDAADGFLVADVGGTQTSRRKSAQMAARLDQHNTPIHPCRLHGGGDAG